MVLASPGRNDQAALGRDCDQLGIALFEYCLAVPANRIGYLAGWSGGQLEVTQEVIALVVFGVFMVTVLGQPIGWRHLGAFLCLVAAVAFLFVGK